MSYDWSNGAPPGARAADAKSLGSTALTRSSLGNDIPYWAPAVREGSPESLTGFTEATTGQKVVLLGAAAGLIYLLRRMAKKKR